MMFGLFAGLGVHTGTLVHSAGYLSLITTVLAVGLYSSTRGIEFNQLRGDLRSVVLAITVGVFLKAALVSVVMYLLFRRPEYLVLGVVVAQIDPLSVAALQGRSRMSERSKALLLAWASFDDPVTVLLTIYAAAITLAVQHSGHGLGRGFADDGLMPFIWDLLWNVVFALTVLALWCAGKLLLHRVGPRGTRWTRRWTVLTVQCVVLGAAIIVAVLTFWMLGIALVGLFLRPPIPRLIDRATALAFLLATFALGMVLVLGVSLLPGVVLGVVAFLAHALVSRQISRGQQATDRVYLAVAQQNGVTAIILALLLERDFPGIVATVAPAILVINVLHLVTNALYDSSAPRARRLVQNTVAFGLESRTPSVDRVSAGDESKPLDRQPTGAVLVSTHSSTEVPAPVARSISLVAKSGKPVA